VTLPSTTVPKIAILAPSEGELEEVVSFLAQSHGQQPIARSKFGGAEVFRTRLQFSSSGGELVELNIFASSVIADYREVFQFLFKQAAGVLCLLPVGRDRVEEARQVLALLQTQLLMRRSSEQTPPFVLQYHWTPVDQGVSPEEVDKALGVNIRVVTRAFSGSNHPSQQDGISALLKLIGQKEEELAKNS